MHAEPQPDVSLHALRQAIRDDDDAEIVRLWTSAEFNRIGVLAPQERARVDLAMRRALLKTPKPHPFRRALPFLVGGLVLIAAVIVGALVILPRLLAGLTPAPGVPTSAVRLATGTPVSTATPNPALVGAEGRAVPQKRTSTPTQTSVPPTQTSVPPTQTSVPPTQTSVPPTRTPEPTPTQTSVAPSATPSPSPAALPSPTSSRPAAPAQTPTPTPTSSLRPAPRLEAPPNGTSFVGWNAGVVLEWSSVGALAADEYHVVRIPYDNAGGVAEFWRKETSLQVPPHFSGRAVGFTDRHYNWTVQVMRCTENCANVTDDNARKNGQAASVESAEGLFYWHPDTGGGPGPAPTPTRE